MDSTYFYEKGSYLDRVSLVLRASVYHHKSQAGRGLEVWYQERGDSDIRVSVVLVHVVVDRTRIPPHRWYRQVGQESWALSVTVFHAGP